MPNRPTEDHALDNVDFGDLSAKVVPQLLGPSPISDHKAIVLLFAFLGRSDTWIAADQQNKRENITETKRKGYRQLLKLVPELAQLQDVPFYSAHAGAPRGRRKVRNDP